MVNDKDEVTGEISAEIDTFRRLKSQVPLLFTEKYVLIEKNGQYRLLTKTQRRFRAGTQLGAGGKFNAEEEPDIKTLLRKAGMSTEDKPPIITKS